MKLEKEYNNIDNMPIIEIFMILRNEKRIILGITLFFIISSSIYSYSKAQEPSIYNVTIKYESSNNLEFSIQLLEAISKKINPNTHLSTAVTIKYAPEDSPYSPINLFLRFSEELTSPEFKKKYIERTKLSPALENTIKNITTNYPTHNNLQFLISKSFFSPNETNSIKKHKESLYNYFNWAKAEFMKKTMQQTGINTVGYNFIHEHPVKIKKVYPKESSYSLLVLSTTLGFIISIIIISIKRANKNKSKT